MSAARKLQELLGLRRPPVAVSFRDTPPPGVSRVATGPSSCSYWKLAGEGRAFFTEAADHYNCAIGAYTHNVEAPPEVNKQLEGTVTWMVGLGYLRMEEVPGIPRRNRPFRVAVYSSLEQAQGEPDVVIVGGNAKQMMLLAEAAQAAGVAGGGPMGRPTCAALPEAMQNNRGVLSLGCIGNRTYTELADDEMYFALPGGQFGAVAEQLTAIVRANEELQKYHRQRSADVARQSAVTG
jgi:uncharacterized protein (DUF169 family)